MRYVSKYGNHLFVKLRDCLFFFQYHLIANRAGLYFLGPPALKKLAAVLAAGGGGRAAEEASGGGGAGGKWPDAGGPLATGPTTATGFAV